MTNYQGRWSWKDYDAFQEAKKRRDLEDSQRTIDGCLSAVGKFLLKYTLPAIFIIGVFKEFGFVNGIIFFSWIALSSVVGAY